MKEVCESCAQLIDDALVVVWCDVCKSTPYCSITCRDRDASTQHHRRDKNGTCMDPNDKRMWAYLAQQLGLTQLTKLPVIDDVGILVWPGPIGGSIPHAMRHSDSNAHEVLKILTSTNKQSALQPYYSVVMRDLPRVWFRQLKSAQRNELRALILSHLSTITKNINEQVHKK